MKRKKAKNRRHKKEKKIINMDSRHQVIKNAMNISKNKETIYDFYYIDRREMYTCSNK